MPPSGTPTSVITPTVPVSAVHGRVACATSGGCADAVAVEPHHYDRDRVAHQKMNRRPPPNFEAALPHPAPRSRAMWASA